MPAIHRLGFPITTVFDNDFIDLPFLEEELKEVYEDIIDPELFGDNAWSRSDRGLVLDITLDKTEKITDEARLKQRGVVASRFITSHDGIGLHPEWVDGNRNAILFPGIDTKKSLMFRVITTYPEPEKKHVVDPQEILDILNALEDGLEPNNEGYAKATIKPDSALEQLLGDPDVADRFSVVMQNMGLNVTIYLDDEEQFQIELPVMYVTRPHAYQAKVAEIKNELAARVLGENLELVENSDVDDDISTIAPFAILSAFDGEFFESPYQPDEIQEIFEDILDENVFPDDAWSEIRGYADNVLMLDITRDLSGQALAPTQLEYRRAQIQLFMESLQEYSTASSGQSIITSLFPLCKWQDDDKDVIEFSGYASKEALAEAIHDLFPRPDQSTITDPREIIDILDALDDGLEFNEVNDIVPKIKLDSVLSQLVSADPDPETAERFNKATEVWGLNFLIDTDDMDVSLPIMYITRHDEYQARLAEMKDDLLKLESDIKRQMHEQGFRITTALDNDFIAYPFSEAGVREIFDDLLDNNVFNEHAWSHGIDMYAKYIELNISKDKSGKTLPQNQLEVRINQAAMLLGSIRELTQDNGPEKKSPEVTLAGGSIRFYGFSSKEELENKIDDLFPRPTTDSIENPREMLDILNALDEGLEFNNMPDAIADIKPGSDLHELFNNPDVVERFNDAVFSLGLAFYLGAEDDEIEMSAPIISITRPNEYQARLAQAKVKLEVMILQKIGPFEVKNVFDDAFFIFPDEDNLREIFQDILDPEVFGDDAWMVSATPSLIFDINSNESGEITNPRHLRMRRQQVQIFLDALKGYDLECRWWDEGHTAIAFTGLKSKDELEAKVKSLFPQPDKSSVKDPQQMLDILNALDDGPDIDTDNLLCGTIKENSTLSTLLDDPHVDGWRLNYYVADNFTQAAAAWGLCFVIEDDQIFLPVIALTRPNTYQAKLREMKNDLIAAVSAAQGSVDTTPPMAPIMHSQTLVLTEAEPVTKSPVQVSQATLVMSVGQYNQYVENNKKFHFFGAAEENENENEVKVHIKLK